jgi:hypothetical protein
MTCPFNAALYQPTLDVRSWPKAVVDHRLYLGRYS